MKYSRWMLLLLALVVALACTACNDEEVKNTNDNTESQTPGISDTTGGGDDEVGGDAVVSEDGVFVFNKLADGTYEVALAGEFTGDTLEIPASYQSEIKVSAIADAAFYGSSSLKSVTIPDGIVSIGTNAFYGCDKLNNVKLPSTVKTIGWNAFADCTALAEITFEGSLTALGAHAFDNTAYAAAKSDAEFYFGDHCLVSANVSGDYAVKSDVTCVADGAFAGCTNLTSVSFPDGVSVIGSRLFDGCVSLTHVSVAGDVTEIGERAFNGCVSFKTFAFGDKLEVIGDGAFYGCSVLESVNVPDSVTEIGAWSFYNCGKLATVNINVSTSKLDSLGAGAFAGCSALTSVALPDSIATIGDETFLDCVRLSSIVVPDAVTYIGREAFRGCTALTFVQISQDSQLQFVGDGAFYNCGLLTQMYFPKGVQSIGREAFRDCNNLKSLTIPFVGADRNAWKEQSSSALFGYIFGYSLVYVEGADAQEYAVGQTVYAYIPDSLTQVTLNDVSNIGYGAFSNCKDIVTLSIPSEIDSIGAYAFSGCANLKNFTVPEKLVEIPEGAFSGCVSLQKIELSDTVTSVGARAFEGCAAMTEFAMSENVTAIGVSAFADCTQLTKLDILDSNENEEIEWNITILANGVFQNCKKLESLNIPATVNVIDDAAFSGCASLKNISIPTAVMRINDRAFEGCSSLTSMTIPSNVSTVGLSAFKDCSALKELVINASACSAFGDQTNPAFAGCYNLENVVFGGPMFDDEGKPVLDGDGDEIFYTVEIVPAYAFAKSAIKDLVLPVSIKEIGAGAFSDCALLETVTISENLSVIPASAFAGCVSLKSVKIPASVQSIDESAFEGCVALEAVAINADQDGRYSLLTIDSKAFFGCTSLKSINFPVSLVKLGDRCFQNCTSLEMVDMEACEQVKTLYAETFLDCSSLKTVKLPKFLQELGAGYDPSKEAVSFLGAFENTALTTIDIPGTVTIIYIKSFKGCDALTDVNFLTTELPVLDDAGSPVLVDGKEVTAPGYSLITIAQRAFEGSGITSINVPGTVRSVFAYAFKDCASLKNVTFGQGCEIGEFQTDVFRNCSSIETFVLPKTVTKVVARAFQKVPKGIKLYYGGTHAEFEEFAGSTAVVSTQNDAIKKNKNIYAYSEEQPTEAGKYWHYDNAGNVVEW